MEKQVATMKRMEEQVEKMEESITKEKREAEIEAQSAENRAEMCGTLVASLVKLLAEIEHAPEFSYGIKKRIADADATFLKSMTEAKKKFADLESKMVKAGFSMP